MPREPNLNFRFNREKIELAKQAALKHEITLSEFFRRAIIAALEAEAKDKAEA